MGESSKFVKLLASNDRKTREAALDLLKKYLSSKSSAQLNLEELKKLWKGLYFSMWFCDRARPQERLAENLGALFSETIPLSRFADFIEAFWTVMIREWSSIDQWRIDKFYLLIRRVVRHSFIRLNKEKWNSQTVDEFLSVYEKLVLSGDQKVSVALPYHLCDIYLDELERVMFNTTDEGAEDDADDKEEQDQGEDAENSSKDIQKKREVMEQVPLSKLIEPFVKLSKDAKLKTLREKCKNEVLDDLRLKEWGIMEESESEEEEEWTGFN